MSSINPNNIDGTYPIAGQDNDSQGFRSNFTNIKNNFTYSKAEIEDLQNNALLKTALSGTTLDNNLNNVQLKGAQLIRTTETRVDLGSLGGASPVTVLWSDGHFQTVTTAGSITLTLDQWPTSGFWTSLKLQVNVTNTAHTLTLPTEVSVNQGSIKGITGQTVTFPSTGIYQFEFSTYNGGTDVAVRDLLRNYSAGFDANTASLVTLNVTGTSGNALSVNQNMTANGNAYVGGFLSVAGAINGGTLSVAGAVNGGVSTFTNVSASTGVRVTSSTGKLGYNAGGNITQGTNKYTGVTLNSATGTITMVNTSMANGNVATFTLTNSVVESSDYILVQHQSVGTLGAYVCTASPGSGSTQIHVTKLTTDAGPLSEAIVLRFAVIKSANS